MSLAKSVSLMIGAMICSPLLAAEPPPSNVDPQADRVLRAMSDYIANDKSFRVVTENTIEVVTDDGQKIQFTAPSSIIVSRPDRFVARRRGDIVDQAFYYDGKALTLHNLATNHYATVEAPAGIDAALDFARDELDVIAPAADLLDTRSYSRLMADATSGKYLGLAVVGGHRCHHLAYRASLVDWQLWVREGGKPVPCKYVITSRDTAGAPQFAMHVTAWDSGYAAQPSDFVFRPSPDAVGIEFLPVQQEESP